MPSNTEIVKTMGLEDITRYIKCEMRNSVRNVITVGYCLKTVKEKEIFKEKYDTFREYAKEEFNLSESEASRYLSINAKYSQGGSSCEVAGSYEQYSVGVLIEMLNMDEEERKEIPVEATVREVRQLKKEKLELATSQEVKEAVSIIGLPKTEQKVGSSLEPQGCGNRYDCFSCHRGGCDMRQKVCYCVEAPRGAPFGCTTINVVENLKQDAGEACQFIALEKAYQRTGDKEPVPCCKNCKEKCGYACQRSMLQEETTLEAEYREVEETPKQSIFPMLKNKEQREQFINSYKEWPLWFETEQTEETCYRFDLPDKSSIAVRCYLITNYWDKKECESEEYFLLKEGQHFRSCKTSMSELIEHLKEVQKGVVNG